MMSHFCTLVLIPQGCPEPEKKVAELLAPYSENGEWFADGSRWDWWQIGGRWTGVMSDYRPEDDPENHESCELCGGCGLRTDEIGNHHREIDPDYKCNGCDGKGWKVKWPTQWKTVTEKDVVPVSQVPPEFTSFALVTPDGKWREKGRMLWFATTEDEVDEAEWETTFRAQLGEWQDSTAVIVDCHV
jgi:hypothetical protein